MYYNKLERNETLTISIRNMGRSGILQIIITIQQLKNKYFSIYNILINKNKINTIKNF